MEYTDYKNQAISDLSNYTQFKARADTLTRQIDMLSDIVNTTCDKSNVSNPAHSVPDCIARLETLRSDLHNINFRIMCVDSTLDALTESERELITSFYITRQRNTVNTLARKNYTDRSCIYRRAVKALEKYIYICFGVRKT